MLCVPLVALAPLQPPEAVHEVAFVEFHVNVELPPFAIDVGFAVRLAVAAGTIVTTAAAGVLAPPAPEQVNEYDLVAVRGPVLCVPLVALVPLQPPEAVHEVAFVELHVSVELLPLAIDVGIAVRVTVAGGTTVMIAVAAVLEPPTPVQVSEYDVVAETGPMLCVPLVAFVPLQPPEAVHEVAFVEFHANVELPPFAIDAGFAVSVAVGLPGTVTVAVTTLLVPPAPVQVSEYDVVAETGPMLCVPLVVFVPLQPPTAVHEVAFAEFHVNVELPPFAIDAGFALKVTVAAGTTVTIAVVGLLAPPAPVQVKE